VLARFIRLKFGFAFRRERLTGTGFHVGLHRRSRLQGVGLSPGEDQCGRRGANGDGFGSGQELEGAEEAEGSLGRGEEDAEAGGSCAGAAVLSRGHD